MWLTSAGLALVVPAGRETGVKESEVISVATWNLEWFYDDFSPDNRTDLGKEKSAPSRADWDWKRRSVAQRDRRIAANDYVSAGG